MKNYNYFLRVIVTLFVLAGLSSCGNGDGPSPKDGPSGEFTPVPFVKVGNEWHYLQWFLGEAAPLRIKIISEENPYTFTVEINNDGAVRLQTWYLEGDFIYTAGADETFKEAEPIYKSNPSIGDSWEGSDGSTEFLYTVKQTKTDVETIDGQLFRNMIEIEVLKSTSLLPQSNYWHPDSGMLYIYGVPEVELDSIVLN